MEIDSLVALTKFNLRNPNIEKSVAEKIDFQFYANQRWQKIGHGKVGLKVVVVMTKKSRK